MKREGSGHLSFNSWYYQLYSRKHGRRVTDRHRHAFGISCLHLQTQALSFIVVHEFRISIYQGVR